MGSKKTLIISIIIFIIAGICALLLILNKGYVGEKSLVAYEEVHELAVKCDKEYISVTEDEEATIKVFLDGEEIEDGYELLLEEDEKKITLDENIVTAKKVGTATITAKLIDSDLVATTNITVYRPIKNLKLDAKGTTLRVGSDRQLTATVKPTNATITYLSYESSDPEIATVNNNGIVTGVSKGTVTITVTDNITGQTASVKQTVR